MSQRHSIRLRTPRPFDAPRLYAGLSEAERLIRKAESSESPRHRWAFVVAARQVIRLAYRDAGLVPGGQA